MNSVIISFLIGGILIGSTRYASGLIGPEYASLVGGLPSGLVVPFFLAASPEKLKFISGYRQFVLLFCIVLLEMYYLLYHTELSGEWIGGISILSWIAISATFMAFRKGSSKATS